MKKLGKIALNIVATLFIFAFFSAMAYSLHEAEKKANDPNTPPAERERIKREITAALLNMG